MKSIIPPAILDQHLAILGKTGRGKTNTAKVCVEQVYDQGSRVCILDTIKSDWWGLTSSADGRRAGLPFHILGGPHAHFPLTASMGKPIADLIARGDLKHTILDMAEFEPGGQMRFFADFAPRLLQRMKGVLYVVIEEAHLLAPKERAGMGHENMSVHWAKMLATAGRTKGIRLLILSQRTQAVHNAVLGSCDSMIVHGMTAPADMEPVTKWLKANNKDKQLNAEIEGSLSGLKTGTAWLCSSEARIFEQREFPKARTYDNTATPTGDEELAAVKTAPIDLDKLRAILGKAAIEAEANDPKALHKRIAELEAQIRKGGNGTDPQLAARELQRARNDAATAADMARHHGFKEGADEGYRQAIQTLYARTTAAIEHIQETCTKELQRTKDTLEGAVPPKRSRSDVDSTHSNKLLLATKVDKHLLDWTVKAVSAGFGMGHPKREGGIDADSITGLRAELLAGLRWFENQGMDPAPRAALAGIVQKTLDKGYGARTLGELKTAGLVTYPVPGTIQLTAEGRELAPPPPQYATLYDAWEERLSGLHLDVLRQLKDVHPEPVTRESLGGMLEKTFDKGYGARALGELKTMGVVEYPVAGSLRLTKYVMP